MIGTWITQLGSESLLERLTAEDRLSAAGTDAESALIAALGDADMERRWRVAGVCGDIGSHAAVVPLIELLNDDTWDVRAGAAYALGVIGDERAFELFSRTALSPHPDEQTPYVAALGLLRMNRARALETLNAAVTHDDEKIRRTALSALAADRWRVA